MPRVLFNMSSQYAARHSGVARVAFELLGQLVGRGNFQYMLRSPWSASQLPAFLQVLPLEIDVVERPSNLLFDVVRRALTFGSYCRDHNIDLVVNLDPFGTPTGGKARILIAHDLYFKTLPDQLGWRAGLTNELIYRIMLAGNSNIVTVSRATQADVEKWYPATKGRVTTIHSATSLRPVDAARRPADLPDRYVLAVGNATPNKNYGALAEAMAMIHASDPDLALVHVGDDPQEVLSNTLERLGTPVRLLRLAGIDDACLADLYAHASCLCVPSLSEGFCLPILEAQICRCPVVCSNRSAMPEIAGRGAILVDPTAPAAIAEAIRSVVTSPDKAASLIQSGLDNAAAFSWEQTASHYQDLFTRILAAR